MQHKAAKKAGPHGLAEHDDRGGAVVSRPMDISSIVRTLMTEHADPARVLELYYWCQEPGLVDAIRALVALPKKSRAALQAFLVMVENPRLVSATVDQFGRLTLFSPQVAETVALLRAVVKDDQRVVRL